MNEIAHDFRFFCDFKDDRNDHQRSESEITAKKGRASWSFYQPLVASHFSATIVHKAKERH